MMSVNYNIKSSISRLHAAEHCQLIKHLYVNYKLPHLGSKLEKGGSPSQTQLRKLTVPLDKGMGGGPFPPNCIQFHVVDNSFKGRVLLNFSPHLMPGHLCTNSKSYVMTLCFLLAYGVAKILQNNLQNGLLYFLFIHHFQLRVNRKSEKNETMKTRSNYYVVSGPGLCGSAGWTPSCALKVC